jgi:hypothetical protein
VHALDIVINFGFKHIILPIPILVPRPVPEKHACAVLRFVEVHFLFGSAGEFALLKLRAQAPLFCESNRLKVHDLLNVQFLKELSLLSLFFGSCLVGLLLLLL